VRVPNIASASRNSFEVLMIFLGLHTYLNPKRPVIHKRIIPSGERERERQTRTRAHTHTHTHIYIYIYSGSHDNEFLISTMSREVLPRSPRNTPSI
jgi:hypothetical protein